jgi:alpha-beta hydrolase superfamily lysophospholipase
MSETTQAPYTLRDGLNIALYDWPLPRRQRPRAVVLIVHGLGEHAWRYDTVAQRLNEWGYCVRAYDQRGHGESGGTRGVLQNDDDLLEDLDELIEDTRRHIAQPWSCPLVLLGHSMGGLVASTLVQRGRASVDALVLSSPALDTGMSGFQRWMTRVLYRWAPDLTVSNGLDPGGISHDPAQVAAYRSDRLVHDRISARLARFIDSNGPHVVAAAPTWPLPTLLMYAGADRLVRPAGSQAFAAVAPPQQVHSRGFDGLFHELFNEADPSAVYAELRTWLDQRFPA